MFKWVFPAFFLFLVACQTSIPMPTAMLESPTVVPATPSHLPSTTTMVLPTPSPSATDAVPIVTVVLPTDTPLPPTPSPRVTATAITPTPIRVAPLYPATHGGFTRLAILPEEFPGNIIALRPQPDNPDYLQMITSEGYLLIHQETGEVTTHLIPVSALMVNVDSHNVIWYTVGNDSLYAWNGVNEPQIFGPETGWTPVIDSSALIGQPLVADGNGHLWLATGQDVRRFDGQQWTVYTREAMFMAAPDHEDLFPLFTLAYSPLTQTIWVGECDWGGPGPIGGGGVRWFDGTLWHGADSPVAQGCATGMAEAENGYIWLAVDALLWRFYPADSSWAIFVPFVPDDVPRLGYVEKLVLDTQGNPWPLLTICGGASCQNGYVLYRLRDDIWTQAAAISTDIPLVLFNSEGLAYLFTDNQMFIHTLGNALLPLSDFTMPVAAAYLDSQDNLWLVARPDPDLPLAIWYQFARG